MNEDEVAALLFLLRSRTAYYKARIEETPKESPQVRTPGLVETTGALNRFFSSVVVVPDVHARPDFIEWLSETFPYSYFVFVGDLIHSENRERWRQVETELGSYDALWRFCKSSSPDTVPPALREEINDNLRTLRAVLDLVEIGYGTIVKGNHDVLEGPRGYEVFGKFVHNALMESGCFAEGLKKLYPEVHQAYEEFSKLVPFISVFPEYGFGVSHAALGDAFSPNRWSADDAYFKLCWTDNTYDWNTSWMAYTADMMSALLPGDKTRWFIGHRPVKDRDYRSYDLGKGRHLYQINHPEFFSCIIVPLHGDHMVYSMHDPKEDLTLSGLM